MPSGPAPRNTVRCTWSASGLLYVFTQVASALGCAGPPAAQPATARPAAAGATSTQEMAATLKERAAMVDPSKLDLLVNDRRAALLIERLASPQPLGARLGMQFDLATELLNAGRIQDCLAAIDALEKDAKINAPEGWRQHGPDVIVLRAMAYLRLAEEQNCHQANNPQSCLFPLRGEGVHRARDGSTRAAAVLEALLAEHPQHLTARWLLNVAHMTLGRYPDAVPPRDLIPPKAFASQYALPRFDNVAKEAGLDIHGLAGGAILDDFDNDGRLDLLVSGMGLEEQLRFFHNRGDGRFEERTREAGLTGEVGGLNMIQADYDNDGFVDAVVLRGGWMGSEGRFPLSLLRNNGDGTFTDTTRAAGLLRFVPTQTATWLDYDGDGWLDLFVGNESDPGAPPELVHRCELFHSNRDGTFTNVAPEAGLDLAAFVKGVASGDFNNDGRPDLYVSVRGEANRLYRNDGPAPGGGRGWRFTDVAREAGVTQPRDSFGTFFFDYDNDSWPDLFVAGFSWTTAGEVGADYLGLPTNAERGRLFRNKGDGRFEDVTRRAGLYKVVPAMGMNYGDLDNDSFLDIYLGTGNPDLSTLVPNRMFRNAGGRVFQDVTTAGNFGHLQKGHAICFGDIDNDGDQDVFEKMGGAYLSDKAYSTLYENPGHANRWLSLELEGVQSNRGAIGARIKVAVEGKGRPRLIHRTVGSGGSFGASPLRQEIGLGDAVRITSVDIFWPATGKTQRIAGLRPNERYRVREGSDTAALVNRPQFTLGGPPPPDGRAPVSTGP